MAHEPSHRHGRTEYFIEGEGVAPAGMPSPRLQRQVPAAAEMVTKPQPADTKRAFRFCRLFKKPDGFPQPDDAKLIALGLALDDPFMPGAGDSTIPAGFTYLGQFVDHDITFDRTQGIPSGSLDPADIEQGRSPALDLDSVYGRGPTKSPELYESDKLHLKIGTTTGRPRFGVTEEFPNDLPRRPANDPNNPKQAIIGDPRNDENLIVAQIHLAFLKFHNKVVDHLQTPGTAEAKLAEARKTVVQHYQSIVLHDFVKQLADPAVFNDVLTNGRKFYFPQGAPAGKYLCMPIEFSVAAYRLGHSMIRNRYQWNRVFSSGGVAGFTPPLSLFFEFSRVSGNLGELPGEPNPTLPSDWIADWRRMFDFGKQPGGTTHPQMNFTRQIDTKLANGLQTLPEFANAQEEHLKSLAVRNLLRGRLVGLPTGQEVAGKIGVPALTPAEVAAEPHSALIIANGFDQETPLWFYILKEAQEKHGGLHLGAVGSRLVVETFHGLVEGSIHSILKQQNWQPTLPAAQQTHFTMNDLLLFVNEVNPLGD